MPPKVKATREEVANDLLKRGIEVHNKRSLRASANRGNGKNADLVRGKLRA